MARWQVKANAQDESTGGGNKFPPAPRGVYTLQVADFKDGITLDSKRPKVELTCKIADQGPEFGKRVWLTVTQIGEGERGHGLMVHALHAFGLPYDGGLDFETSEFQGRTARALIGIQPREKVVNGRTFINQVNFVEQLYTEAHPEPKELPSPPPLKQAVAKPEIKTGDLEEVPF